MQVYKTFMKLVKKLMPILVIQVIVFCFMTIFRPTDNVPTDFSDVRLEISVVNNDGSPASKVFEDHLRSVNEVKDLKSYDDEFVQDSLYYYRTQAVITINEGFEQKLADGETDGLVESRRLPSTYVAQFSDAQIGRFIKTASLYTAAGLDPEEACRKAADAENDRTDVSILSEEGASDVDAGFANYFIYYGFGAIYAFGYVITPIMSKFFNRDIRRRTDSSPIPVSKKTAQLALGVMTQVSAIWLLLMVLAQTRYGCLFSEAGLYCILNSAVYSLTAAGIALFISVMLKAGENYSNALNGIVNGLSLGMAFLCGIFVPQEYLSDSVLAFSRFLPAYWYAKATNIICGLCGEAMDKKAMFGCIGIELLFAAAFFALFLAMNKYKIRSAE